MKRPMAVVGFSMAVTSLISYYIDFKCTVVLGIGITVLFFCFSSIKVLRKNKIFIFSLLGAILYIASFIFAQLGYYNATLDVKNNAQFRGIVCETPQESDYAYTYIIRPENENYKIRYVSEENKMLQEGDIVEGVICSSKNSMNLDFLENSLSLKTYFTFYEGDEAFLNKSVGSNTFYSIVGNIKRWFSSTIDHYLPGESGAIAKAMTIGEKSEIENRTLNGFNYSGTVHLLVISGLHVTLFSLGLIKVVERVSVLRRYSVCIGTLGLLFYCALTGFSVPVVRAGLMVGAVLIGKLIHRGADSINSIGFAIFIILIENPFAANSSAFWFTILSTLSILCFAEKITDKIEKKYAHNRFVQSAIGISIISNIMVSIATTIFTLPVFIVKYNAIPTASIIANIVMVDLATLLMFLTLFGAVFHTFNFSILSNLSFTMTGIISRFLKIFTDKIGYSQWSTISVSHKYYQYFLIVFIVGLTLIFIAKKQNRNIAKHIVVSLSVLFTLTSVYCNLYNYFVPSIDIIAGEYTSVLVNYKGESVLVGIGDKSYNDTIKNCLNAHNDKGIDCVTVLNDTDEMPSHLINIYNEFDVDETYFCFESPKLFQNRSKDNMTWFTIGENLMVDLRSNEDYICFSNGERSLVIIDYEKIKNLFQFVKECDIIILSGNISNTEIEIVKNQLQNEDVYALNNDLSFTLN